MIPVFVAVLAWWAMTMVAEKYDQPTWFRWMVSVPFALLVFWGALLIVTPEELKRGQAVEEQLRTD